MTVQPWLRQVCNEQVGAFAMRHDLSLCAEWTVLFGPSGTGKSTWLRMLAGLEPQRTGTLRLHNVEIRTSPAHHRRITLVEQAPALFPHLDVERNVRFGCVSYGCAEFVPELLERFGLIRLRHSSVAALSGGERQRVALARALGATPRLLLLDEVFTGMDAPLRSELIGVLGHYSSRLKMPILSVTHNVTEVFETSDQVLRMKDGKIIAQGPASEVLAVERAHLLQTLRL